MENAHYTSNLAMGLGLIDETKILLDAWHPNMSASELFDAVLSQGLLRNSSAYRLKNIVNRCFAPRYLARTLPPAIGLKIVKEKFSAAEINQLFFFYTCSANPILIDFIVDVYWTKYAGGYSEISRGEAESFIWRAIDDGKTPSRWSEGQVVRVARYLTGCCADFGLLGDRKVSDWKILPFEIQSRVFTFLAYDLHFSGVGDNALLSHRCWALFGLEKDDVLEEIKRLSLRGLIIVQTAGEVIRISWKYKSMEELCDVLVKS